jgi:hypothetical protein
MAKRFIDGQEVTGSAFLEAVGTVSESSGVPTGAIIESGDNTVSGGYIKYADGTMIAWGTSGAGLSQNANTISYGGVTFASAPRFVYVIRSTSGAYPPNNYVNVESTTSAVVYFASTPASQISLRWHAIGRWY